MTPFEKAFQRGLEGLRAESSGFLAECDECRDNHDFCCVHSAKAAVEAGDSLSEGSFSWEPCDICGSHLGGDRFSAHALDDDGQIIHLEVCTDCVMFMANGELPDNWE